MFGKTTTIAPTLSRKRIEISEIVDFMQSVY